MELLNGAVSLPAELVLLILDLCCIVVDKQTLQRYAPKRLVRAGTTHLTDAEVGELVYLQEEFALFKAGEKGQRDTYHVFESGIDYWGGLGAGVITYKCVQAVSYDYARSTVSRSFTPNYAISFSRVAPYPIDLYCYMLDLATIYKILLIRFEYMDPTTGKQIAKEQIKNILEYIITMWHEKYTFLAIYLQISRNLFCSYSLASLHASTPNLTTNNEATIREFIERMRDDILEMVGKL